MYGLSTEALSMFRHWILKKGGNPSYQIQIVWLHFFLYSVCGCVCYVLCVWTRAREWALFPFFHLFVWLFRVLSLKLTNLEFVWITKCFNTLNINEQRQYAKCVDYDEYLSQNKNEYEPRHLYFAFHIFFITICCLGKTNVIYFQTAREREQYQKNRTNNRKIQSKHITHIVCIANIWKTEVCKWNKILCGVLFGCVCACVCVFLPSKRI